MSLSLTTYALSYFIPDRFAHLFLTASIVSRTLEGFSVAIALNALFSLLSLNYPNHRGRALAARACGASLGMSLGPVLGGSLVMLLGYFGVFIAYAII